MPRLAPDPTGDSMFLARLGGGLAACLLAVAYLAAEAEGGFGRLAVASGPAR